MGGVTGGVGRLLVVVAVVSAQPAVGGEASARARKFYTAGFNRDANVFAFFQTLRRAVADEDRAAVAGMVRYPVVVGMGGRTVTIRSREQFIRQYDGIFTPCMRRVLADGRQDELWGNWRGVAMPRGQIWFVPQGNHEAALVAINGPFGGEKGCHDMATQHSGSGRRRTRR